MVHVASLLGKDKFIQYITQYGLGERTGIDIEGEAVPPLRQKWGDIDVATGSFGQGLAVTSIRMITAVGALANQGIMMQPSVVKQVMTTQGIVDIPPKTIRQVVSQQAAAQITQMMIQSATHGEAHWRLPPGYIIAGKTGTAQVPIEGHYDQDKTIASFIGFAPAHNPRFILLVKLKEPQASPWASETAAPLWFDLASQMLRYFNLPPQDS
jgi:cell division protein FtsI/penicillin-binding protein 2